MAIRIVQLGSSRSAHEGLRIGTVRRPPRGVPKSEFAARNFYDVWLPNLAPSEALVKQALAANDERSWRAFVRRYRAEMKTPSPASSIRSPRCRIRQTSPSAAIARTRHAAIDQC